MKLALSSLVRFVGLSIGIATVLGVVLWLFGVKIDPACNLFLHKVGECYPVWYDEPPIKMRN